MKKVTAAILALIMVMGLCGCSIYVNTPEDEVNGLMEALKNKDEDVLVLYSDNTELNALLHTTGNEEDMARIYDSVMKNLAWEIVNVNEDKEGGTAQVEVKITNADFSDVQEDYQDAAVKYTKENMQKSDFTKESMGDKCVSIYADTAEKAAEADTVTDETVIIELTKNDSYGWDMIITDEIMDIILGGISFPL